jgi:D-threonate/D-erythronate kinase
VGSGGLAAALARALTPGQPGGGPRPLQRNAPVLFCIGSDHPATSAQQAALLARRNVQMVFWDFAKREDMVNALQSHRHVCLQIPRGAAPAEQVRELIGAAHAIVLSGGDTASLVCQAVGVQAIELCGEIASGIPYGVLQGGDLDGIAVATKSGGFGREEALIEIADFFYAPISNDVA